MCWRHALGQQAKEERTLRAFLSLRQAHWFSALAAHWKPQGTFQNPDDAVQRFWFNASGYSLPLGFLKAPPGDSGVQQSLRASYLDGAGQVVFTGFPFTDFRVSSTTGTSLGNIRAHALTWRGFEESGKKA